jgi:hypothetical protein
MPDWLTLDPYRVRLDRLQRLFVCVLVLAALIGFGASLFGPHLIGPSRWMARLPYLLPGGVFLLLAPFMVAHQMTIRRQARAANFKLCPACRYSLVDQGNSSVRCTECGFLGEARLVETTWKQYCGVR